MAKKSTLRSKYKATPIADLKSKADKEDSMVGATSRDEFLELKDGKTIKFRLFPAHDGPDFMVMRKRHWIQIEGDSGPTKRTVLNSRQHGGTKKDIIDEYIAFSRTNLKDSKKLEAMLDGFKGGLAAEHSWIAYAEKISKDGNEFGLLQLKKMVRDEINKASFMEDDDDPIEVDPFTDPDEGLPILIKYNANPNKKKNEKYYEVSIGKKATPVTDESLEAFDAATPLAEKYLNCYGLKDFELALEGLKWYDAEHEIDFFEDERWLEIVEEVKDQYEDSDEDDDDDDEEDKPKSKKKPASKAKAKSKKKPEPEEDDEDEDEDDSDEEEEEEEKPTKKSSKKPVAKSKKKVEEEEEDEEEDEEEEEEEEEDEDDDDSDEDEEEEDDDEEEKPKSKKLSMDDIRNRLGGKKKK